MSWCLMRDRKKALNLVQGFFIDISVLVVVLVVVCAARVLPVA